MEHVTLEDGLSQLADKIISDAEAAREEGPCNCPAIEQENKFLGQVYDHKGNYVETLHDSTKKGIKSYLKNPENWGKRVLVYKAVEAYVSDTPIITLSQKNKK